MSNLRRALGLAAFGTSLLLASPATATPGTLVWEDEYTNNAALDGTSVTNGGVDVDLTVTVFDDFDGGTADLSPFSGTEYVRASTGTTGNHGGYGFLGFDNTDNDSADFVELEMVFSVAVTELTFSLLDIDERAQGGSTDFKDGVIVTYNNDLNIILSPSFYTLGSHVTANGTLNQFEGLAHQPSGQATGSFSTDGNLDIDFGTTGVTSVKIRYFSTTDAPANPSRQLLGISDLTWTPEPGTGLLFSIGLLFGAMRGPRRTRTTSSNR